MARYAVGDIQGCWHSFQALLETLSFDASRDTLFLAGDLVNRGNGSVNVLRFCMENDVKAVLGNHDLHLLACLFDKATPRPKDTLGPILNDPKRGAIRDYLLSLPLIIEEDDMVMAHAGFWPGWKLEQSVHAAEKAQAYWEKDPESFFTSMYGNHPALPELAANSMDKHRFAVNVCTRMRMLGPDLSLELSFKGKPEDTSKTRPWFEFDSWLSESSKTAVFGHWAALGSHQVRSNLIALDGGCVWGERLSAFDLDNRCWTHQPTHTKDIER